MPQLNISDSLAVAEIDPWHAHFPQQKIEIDVAALAVQASGESVAIVSWMLEHAYFEGGVAVETAQVPLPVLPPEWVRTRACGLPKV